MDPSETELLAAMEATWPAAAYGRVGPWTIRLGRGGGKRVSATTVEGPWSAIDIPLAEAAMDALGQDRLFMLRPQDAGLDRELDLRGYRVVDPVELHAAQVAALAPIPGPMEAFAHWPPLAIAADLWAEAGIGAARLAVMDRVQDPHAALLGRKSDCAAGVAFVAVHGRIAMIHALEVPQAGRRQGTGGMLLRAAAAWGAEQGADWLALAVTRANMPARALYASLGLQVVGQYHYRQG